MRGFSISPYKVEAPSLSDGTLRRDRLLGWLETAVEQKVVLVAAGAGYGKTTLLADWSRRTSLRTAWYRIDEGDRDWITFLRYLVAAGRACEPAFAPVTADLITDIAATGMTMEEIVDTYLRELELLGEPRTALVLDDYHIVDGVAEIRTIMQQLVRRIPPGVTVVVSSRRGPRLPLARLRSHNQLAELTTDDLRFSPEETERLFRESYQRPLDEEVVATLCQRTEGWPASLQLVEAAIRERTAAEARSFIDGLSGGRSKLYDYLAEEVVGVLEPDLQRFLMETAVLQRIEPELAAVASSRPADEVERLLNDAAQAGLLPAAGDEERPLRYHPLVADFLLARLASEVGSRGVAAIHERVAQYLETSEWRLACYHYAAAGNDDAARRVAEGALSDIMASGDYAFAERYLSGGKGDSSAALDIVRSRLEFHRNNTEGALAGARSAVAAAPSHLREAAVANLMTLTFATGAIEEARSLAESLRTSPSAHYRSLGTGMAVVIGSVLGTLNLVTAADLMREMAETFRSSGMNRYLGIALNNLMTMLRPVGRAKEMLRYADEAESALSRGGGSPEVANVLSLRAWAEAYLGRLSEAAEHLALARATQHLAIRADVLIEAAELHTCFGSDQEAEDLLTEAEPITRRHPPLREMWHSARLLLALRQAEVAGAYSHAAELTGAGSYNPGQRSQNAALAAHAALLGRSGDCREQLMRALEITRLQSARFWTNYCRILLASLDGAESLNATITGLCGEDRAMVSVLAEVILDYLATLDTPALEIVKSEAELRPERWRPALRRAIEASDSALKLAAGRLLDRVGAPDDVPRLRALARSLRGPYAEPQLGRGLAKRLAPPLFIDDLGSVTIHVGDRTIRGAQIRRKPLALLCFLLARPEWRVTRDQVVDALWPENAPEDAVNSLNQTLYFLRRLIDPRYSEDLSPAYILNSGEMVWLDEDLVESRSRRVRILAHELTRNLDVQRVEALLREYRGPFALDFAYEEWALSYRDNLHASVLDIAERSIPLAIDRRLFGEAIAIAKRALEIDPEADQIELSLVRLYRLTGAHRAAAEQYAHYAATVRRELGVEPPPLESL